MMIFDIPEWVQLAFVASTSLFFFSISTLLLMMIAGIINGAIQQRWRNKNARHTRYDG